MRRALTVLVAATTSLVLVAFLVPLGLLIRTMASDRAVAAATAQAQSLAPVVAAADRATVEAAIAQVTGGTGRQVTVFFPDGQILGTPVARSIGVDVAARGESVTVATSGGREILVAVQGLPGGTAVIRTYVPTTELYAGVGRAWLILLLLGVLLLGVGLLVANRLARSLVRPISDLATVSHQLASGNLDARIRPAGTPELRDVAAALNHLAGRISDLVAQERERVADISHRLRTPLTALRLEADRLMDPAAASDMRQAVDAMERAVSRVIEDARAPVQGHPPHIDAAAVVRERVDFWSVLAEDQDRMMNVDLAPGPLPVALTREDLAACVDALLGNVFAHTPEGADFGVRLALREPNGAVLEVSDSGTGFAGSDAVRRGTSGGGSTGLGLDIVREAAQRSGGSLRIGTAANGGALVVVVFGGSQVESS